MADLPSPHRQPPVLTSAIYQSFRWPSLARGVGVSGSARESEEALESARGSEEAPGGTREEAPGGAEVQVLRCCA